MVTDIVIPVRNEVELTKSVVSQLREMDGWNHCWILDNGSDDVETKEYLTQLRHHVNRFSVIPAPNLSIYQMWDWGFQCSRFSDHVLFLNNDVVMHPDTIVKLSQALEANNDHWVAYPDYTATEAFGNMCNYRYTQGTFRHGGMAGFCFMLKTSKITWEPLVDNRFVWWCGDDDLAFNIEAQGGKQVRVVGLPVKHLGSATAKKYDLEAQKAADWKLCREKWGR